MNSKTIQKLARNKRWAISDVNKRPVSVAHIMSDQRIIGVSPYDVDAMVTLDFLIENMPLSTNAAYCLNAMLDDVCVLDIEAKCPDAVKRELLRLPYLYGETSLSGKGIHLVLPLPEIVASDPAQASRKRIQVEGGAYELLLNHWVTFTGNAIDPAENTTSDAKKDAREWNTFAEKLIDSSPSPSHHASIDDAKTERPDTWRGRDLVIAKVTQKAYPKSPDDFQKDLSRYDYGYLNWLYVRINALLPFARRKRPLSADDKVWLLYDCATKALPHRPKHDQPRNGVTWLFWQCQTIVYDDEAKHARSDFRDDMVDMRMRDPHVRKRIQA